MWLPPGRPRGRRSGFEMGDGFAGRVGEGFELGDLGVEARERAGRVAVVSVMFVRGGYSRRRAAM